MSDSTPKPRWLTRTKILAFGMALVAAGYFVPIYQIAESVFGKQETAELFAWLMSAKEKQEAIDAGVTNEVPVVEPDPVVVRDAIDIARVNQHGKNRVDYSRMEVHPLLDFARVEGSNLRFNNRIPSSWWADQSNHLKFPRLHIAWADGGGYYGGHFDWLRSGQQLKTLNNTVNGYMGRRATGTLYFWIVSNDGKHRTNIIEVQ